MKEDLLEKFLSSFDFDHKLAKYDVETCIKWTEMLLEKNLVDKKNGQRLIKTLEEIKNNPEKILPSEDIHYAVEQTLEHLLGKDKDLAGIIRTARSRNDLVVSDERIFLKEKINEIIKLSKNLIKEIVELAKKNLNVVMVGYTHLQPAQPVLFSHYILCFAWWFLRDIERLKDCYKRVDVSVLGSAAFAGSSFDIDRKKIAKKLGFKTISENSVDSVSDRDFITEFIFCCSIIMMHLSRMAEEFIIWCNPNFGYISLPKNLTSGSSIMPQKQNPDYLELIRGKTAKVYSDLIGILVLMKGLPLSYNRDMQEDKIYMFSTYETTKQCVEVMSLIVRNIKVNYEKLIKDVENYDFIFATEIANFLVQNLSYPYKLAHKKTKELLDYCRDKNKKISQLNYEDYVKVLGEKFKKDIVDKIKELLKVENVIKNYKTYGGSSISDVKRQIKKLTYALRKV